MKNIFLALDFEESSNVLTAYAVQFASCFGAKVWVVHIAAPDPDFVGYGVGPQYIRDKRAEELRGEHRFLQTVAKDLNEKVIEAEALLIQGPTVPMILAEAEKLNSDIIITGSHDHGFLHNAMYGHTSKKLINKTRIPLLIVPI